MFGLFKPEPAPEGPIQLSFTVLVERPAADVYRLIDWADPRNAKRQLGHSVEPIEGSSGQFRLIMAEMPEHNFDMTVTEAVPASSYRFATDIKPRVGRLEASSEHYQLGTAGDGQCELTLTISATFFAGLNQKEFKQEVLMVGVACHNALHKLKVLAEEGVEAVRALEAELYN